MRLEPRQGSRPAPGAGLNDGGHAALGPDRGGAARAAESAVAIDLARLARQTGQDVASPAVQAQAPADAAALSYQQQLTLGGGSCGIGTEALKLPRTADHGQLSFVDLVPALGVFPNTQNATYQIALPDFAKLLLCTSGTRTWTLPLATDLPDG